MCSITAHHLIFLIQEPHKIILEKGKIGTDVHLCNLLFKITDYRKSPKCELWLNNKRIHEHDNVEYKIDKNMFQFSILHFESNLEGEYICVVSTAEEPKVSTAVKIVVDSNSGKSTYRHKVQLYSCRIIMHRCRNGGWGGGGGFVCRYRGQ